MLKKAFRNVGTVVGEAIVALVGIGTIYGLGWVSGMKSGAKFSDLMNRAMDEEEQRKAAEAEKTEEEPADEPDEEQQEDNNELPEVELD